MSLGPRFRPPGPETVGSVPDPLADALVDSYVAWREASASVQDAYDRWTSWPSRDLDVAFAGYAAALQREEHAARIYQSQIEGVHHSIRRGAGSWGAARE